MSTARTPLYVPVDGAVILAAAGAVANKLDSGKHAGARVHLAQVAEHADQVAALEAYEVADLDRSGRRPER